MRSLYGKKANSFNLVCLEDTTTLSLPFDKLYEASQTELEIAKVLVDKLMSLAMKKEKRENDFLCLSAEERYVQIQENEPSLLARVTQNDIAKYLGITPVALSRIRKRMATGNWLLGARRWGPGTGY